MNIRDELLTLGELCLIPFALVFVAAVGPPLLIATDALFVSTKADDDKFRREGDRWGVHPEDDPTPARGTWK